MNKLRSSAYSSALKDPMVLRLYDCCDNRAEWARLLDDFSAEMGAHSAVLQGLKLDGARARPFWAMHDTRIDLRGYEELISDANNPRLDGKRFKSAAGRLVSDSDLFRSEEIGVSRSLQERLAKLQLGKFLGCLLPIGTNEFMALALHRKVGDAGDYSARQMERLSYLQYHFATALRLSHVIDTKCVNQQILHAMLDRLSFGFIVLKPDLQLVWANQCADAIARRHASLNLSHGRLTSNRPVDQQKLSVAVGRQAAQDEVSYLRLDADGATLQLTLNRLVDTGNGETCILAIMSEGRLHSSISPEAMQELFSLTATEAHLASALADGLTLEKYALKKRVTLGTARYQLKQIFAKTGAKKQSDLMRQILCSAAAQLVFPRI